MFACFFSKQRSNPLFQRSDIQCVERFQIGKRFDKLEQILSGFLKLPYRQISATELMKYVVMNVIAENRKSGGGIVYVKLIEKMRGENAGGIVLSVKIHSSVAVVCREKSVSLTHNPSPSYTFYQSICPIKITIKELMTRFVANPSTHSVYHKIRRLKRGFPVLRFFIFICCAISLKIPKSRYYICERV